MGLNQIVQIDDLISIESINGCDNLKLTHLMGK